MKGEVNFFSVKFDYSLRKILNRSFNKEAVYLMFGQQITKMK